MKKSASLVLIALGVYALIKAIFVMPQVNRYMAAAGVQAAKEAGFPWGVLAVGCAFVLGGLLLRLPRRRAAS